jgi:hypothetical protein
MHMRRGLLCVCLGLLSFFIVRPGVGQSTSHQRQAGTPDETAQASSADYVGSETCATCHEEAARKFSSNPHARLSLEHGGKGISCEGCHGPGKAHVDGGGDVTKIRRFENLSTAQADETCLTCHSGDHANFERSKHAEAGVGCLSWALQAAEELVALKGQGRGGLSACGKSRALKGHDRGTLWVACRKCLITNGGLSPLRDGFG